MGGLITGATAVVVGSGEAGSAIAVAMHRLGVKVVLCDRVDPPGIRRGRALVDAWYLGVARLSGASAMFCSSLKSIPTVIADYHSIAATTWSWQGVAERLAPLVIIELGAPPMQIEDVPRPGGWELVVRESVSGRYCEVRSTAASGAEPAARSHAAVRNPAPPGHECVLASTTARFHTTRQIGEPVREGDVVASLGRHTIRAPATGHLLGLAFPGAKVPAGAPIVEIVTDGDDAKCFGVAPACAVFAGSVMARMLEQVEA